MFTFWIKGDYEGGIAIPFLCLSAMLTLGFLYFVDDYYHRAEIMRVTTDSYLQDVLFIYGQKEAEEVERGEVKTIEYTTGRVVVDKRNESTTYNISCYLTSGYYKKHILKYE